MQSVFDGNAPSIFFSCAQTKHAAHARVFRLREGEAPWCFGGFFDAKTIFSRRRCMPILRGGKKRFGAKKTRRTSVDPALPPRKKTVFNFFRRMPAEVGERPLCFPRGRTKRDTAYTRCPFLCAHEGSNLGPSQCQCDALPLSYERIISGT